MKATRVMPNVNDHRWTCADCQTEYVSQRAETLAHMAEVHTCPTAEQIERAMRGEYDG